MKRLTLLLSFLFAVGFLFAQSGPGGVGNSSSNILWVKSSDITGLSDGDYIATWSDASGNSNDLTQSNNSYKPVFKTGILNGYAAVRFQSTNNRLIHNSFSDFPTSAVTVFIVNKNNNESSDGIFSYASSASDNDLLLYSSNDYNIYRGGTHLSSNVAGNDNNWHIIDFSWKSSGGTTKLWKDGSQGYSSTMAASTSITAGGCLAIAAEQDAVNGNYAANQTHNGDFTEIIVYNMELNDAQRIIVANYLAAKYGLSISNDKYAYESSYGYDVAGIGRYDASNTHTDAQSAGLLEVFNASDMTSDGEYLLFGHDNGSISSWTSSGSPSNVKRISRVWRLDETGSVGTVSFKVDATDLPALPSGYTRYGIMVDSDGDFSSGASVYDYSTSSTGDVYTIPNVIFSDGDYVTIVAIRPVVEHQTTSSSGNENTNAVITVKLNYIPATSVSVDYTTSDITATAGSDYTAVSGATLTIPSGSNSANYTISVTNDVAVENDEDFKITLSNPSTGLNLGTNTEHTYTIIDDDNPRKVSFNSSSSSGSESTTSVSIGLTLSQADNSNNTTVDYSVTGGTATNGTDYSLSSGTVTFSPGTTTANISFSVTDDATDEDNETIEITLSNPTNCNLQSPYIHTYTINDNDAAPTVQFSSSSSSGSESSGTNNVQLTLSAASEKEVSVSFSTSGTATGSTDYTVSSSPVDFPAGTTSKNITITVSDDSKVEGDETVVLTLSSPVNATLGSTSQHTFTITDNDTYGYQGPGGVGKSANLKLWVRPEDIPGSNDGDRISSWTDRSGNSNTLSQSNSSYQPAYYSNVVNGWPVARFNQTSNRIIHNSFSDFPDDEISVFFVNKSNGESNDGLFSYASSASDNDFLLFSSNNMKIYRANQNNSSGVNISTNSFNIVNVTWEGTSDNVYVYKNGTQGYSGTMSGAANITQGGCLAIGCDQDAIDANYESSQTFTGDFAEIAVYNYVVNSAQRKIIDNYLSSKYDITISDDIYAYDKDDATNPYYYYNVSGIGSQGGSDFQSDSKGYSRVRMNSASSLSSGDYLLWGDDNVDVQNGTFSIPWSATPTDVGNYMKRVWRVDKTGDVGTVTVIVDITGWSFDNSADLVLLIDHDDGDFENASKTALYSYSAPYVTFHNISFSDGDWFTVGEENGEGGSLPVEFLTFEVEKTDGKALLTWTTASETNNDFFAVEKSRDLKNWQETGRVKGRGNSNSLSNYNFVDNNLFSGINYYRIKQVDFDGKYTYSPVRFIENQEITNVKIYPNPLRNRLTIEAPDMVNKVSITDLSGRIVLEKQSASKTMTLDLKGLKSGVYIISLEMNGTNIYRRIVKE